jgi:hypothetical protein
MKIHAVGTELFHADGQLDMTKLIVSVRNFAMHLKIPAVNLKSTN